MHAARFDAWTRRRVGIAAGSVIAAAAGLTSGDEAHARKRKKKLKLNQFGCVNVGGKCRGKDVVCCSGICQGQKPKPGEKDRSRCIAHDTGGCTAAQDPCAGGPDVECTTSGGSPGTCATTTGNAGYCFNLSFLVVGGCRRDADCPAGFGNSACIIACLPGGESVRCVAQSGMGR